MNRILITGANSYIGTHFAEYLAQWPDDYQVETIDLIDGSWKEKNFSIYDALFHVAGIAHIKETKSSAHLYYEINRNLSLEVAHKAKADGVKQFVFMSSMSVYGIDTGIITRNSIPNPKSNYGKSKLEAEEGLKKLDSEGFKVSILRPPMVYGKGCKGNFQAIVKFVDKFFLFPKINNKRSALYITNLCSFVKMVIDKNISGVFFPQNSTYMNTSEMAKQIATTLNKHIFLCSLAGFGVMMLSPFSSRIQKAFGSLIYQNTDIFGYSYCVMNSTESVKESV